MMMILLCFVAGCGTGVDDLQPKQSSSLQFIAEGVVTWEILNAPDLHVDVIPDSFGSAGDYDAPHGPNEYSEAVTVGGSGWYHFVPDPPSGYYTVPASYFRLISDTATQQDLDFQVYEDD
jgi:hypothetical protein